MLLDGALGRDPGDGATFHRRVFDRSAAPSVLECFLEHGVEPCLNVDDERDVVIGPHPPPPANVAYLASFGARGDLMETATSAAVFSFQLFGLPRAVLEPVAEGVRARGLGAATVSHDITHGQFCVTVRPDGISKWEGVLAFWAHAGIDPAGVLAIGDGENDVELLTGAGRSCAPASGSAPLGPRPRPWWAPWRTADGPTSWPCSIRGALVRARHPGARLGARVSTPCQRDCGAGAGSGTSTGWAR